MTLKCYRCGEWDSATQLCGCADRQTIFHGDCREILPLLGRFGLCLTDPPYGIGDLMKGGTWGCSPEYEDMRRWDKLPDIGTLQQAVAISENSIIWGGNYFGLPKSRCWLVWDKRNAVKTMADAELAWTTFDKPVKRISLPVATHTHGHPTEKPLALFKWCLTFTESKTVLDPFLGSGTTLRACKDLGRRGIGIELSEAYCETGANRLNQEVLPFA